MTKLLLVLFIHRIFRLYNTKMYVSSGGICGSSWSSQIFVIFVHHFIYIVTLQLVQLFVFDGCKSISNYSFSIKYVHFLFPDLCRPVVLARTSCESVTNKLALLPILAKFGQWDDIIISRLQAIFQLFSSYPPSFVKLAKNMQDCRNGGCCRRNVYLLNIGAKSFGDGIQDICKYVESNLEPVAGF